MPAWSRAKASADYEQALAEMRRHPCAVAVRYAETALRLHQQIAGRCLSYFHARI